MYSPELIQHVQVFVNQNPELLMTYIRPVSRNGQVENHLCLDTQEIGICVDAYRSNAAYMLENLGIPVENIKIAKHTGDIGSVISKRAASLWINGAKTYGFRYRAAGIAVVEKHGSKCPHEWHLMVEQAHKFAVEQMQLEYEKVSQGYGDHLTDEEVEALLK
jgi:hypothetical protein